MSDPALMPPAPPVEEPPPDVDPASRWDESPPDATTSPPLDKKPFHAEPAPLVNLATAPALPSSARSSSPSSLSSEDGAEEPILTGERSRLRWDGDGGGRDLRGGLSDLADPLVYDATRATVGSVLGHAAELLQPQPGALSAAGELLRDVLAAARRLLETAAASVHRLLPLGLRLAEHVMTVPQWRAVQARSRRCARQAIHQALLELKLPPERREARGLLRALRRRPAPLWAHISLEEAASELASRRPPDRYPGSDPAWDAGREAGAALLAACRAAARARLTEPVPTVPLPPAAGLDRAARLAAVHEVVRSWRYSVHWRYCVDFLRTEEEPLLSRHVYQVRFSIPEPHQPIPRPVAYVFFTLTVSKVKPASEPIEMYYMVETSRLKHVPGEVIFQEKWLVDLINIKLKFWREIKF